MDASISPADIMAALLVGMIIIGLYRIKRGLNKHAARAKVVKEIFRGR